MLRGSWGEGSEADSSSPDHSSRHRARREVGGGCRPGLGKPGPSGKSAATCIASPHCLLPPFTPPLVRVPAMIRMVATTVTPTATRKGSEFLCIKRESWICQRSCQEQHTSPRYEGRAHLLRPSALRWLLVVLGILVVVDIDFPWSRK